MNIEITEGSSTLYVPADNIVKLEAVRVYTVLHEKTGKQYVMSGTLKKVLNKLNSNDDLKNVFFRVHRSCAVNLKEIKQYTISGRGGKVLMSNNQTETVAQLRRSELRKVLKKLKARPDDPFGRGK